MPNRPKKRRRIGSPDKQSYVDRLQSFSGADAIARLIESVVPDAISHGGTLESFDGDDLLRALKPAFANETFTPLDLPVRFTAALAEDAIYTSLHRMERVREGIATLHRYEAYQILSTMLYASLVLRAIPMSQHSTETAPLLTWICDLAEQVTPAIEVLHFRDLHLNKADLFRQMIALRQRALEERLFELGIVRACRCVDRVMLGSGRGLTALFDRVRQLSAQERTRAESIAEEALAGKIGRAVRDRDVLLAREAMHDLCVLAYYRGEQPEDYLELRADSVLAGNVMRFLKSEEFSEAELEPSIRFLSVAENYANLIDVAFPAGDHSADTLSGPF